MVKLSVAEKIPPVVLDVLRFIAQEKGFHLVRTRPASDRRLAGYEFTESSEPVRIERHFLRISDETSLTSESRKLLKEAIARY